MSGLVSDTPTTSCRSCGAAIRWALTAGDGRAIPLNADPDPGGIIRATGRRSAIDGRPFVEVLPADAVAMFDEVSDERWTSHFATCPEADEWRRR